MKRCHYCGWEGDDADLFCLNCGNKLDTFAESDMGEPADEWGYDDRPRRNRWPIIAGLIAVIILLVTGTGYMIHTTRKEKKIEKQIEGYYNTIKKIHDRQVSDYLEEATDVEASDKFLDQANEIRDNDNLTGEKKASTLKDLCEEVEKNDESLRKQQEEELDKGFSRLQGASFDKFNPKKHGYIKEYLVEGEEQKINQFESDYASDIEGFHYRKARDVLTDYENLDKQIMDDSDTGNKNRYSANTLLLEDEFIPETLDFLVDGDTYGDRLDNSHFTVFEQIGEKGEKHYLKSEVISAQQQSNGMVLYQIHFQTRDDSDYDTGRGYRVHVRNAKGTRGFDAEEKVIPKAKVKDAVEEELKKFISAFNHDCARDYKTFDQLRNCLESGSQAYDDFKDQPSKPNILGEGITGIEDGTTSMEIAKDGESVKVSLTFDFELGIRVAYGDMKDKEKSYVRKGSRRNFDVLDLNKKTYAVNENYDASLLKNAVFLSRETRTEKDVFRFRIVDNKKVGPIFEHSNDNSVVASVIEMGFDTEHSKLLSGSEKQEIYDYYFPPEPEDDEDYSDDEYDDEYEGDVSYDDDEDWEDEDEEW